MLSVFILLIQFNSILYTQSLKKIITCGQQTRHIF